MMQMKLIPLESCHILFVESLCFIMVFHKYKVQPSQRIWLTVKYSNMHYNCREKAQFQLLLAKRGPVSLLLQVVLTFCHFVLATGMAAC